MASSSGQTRAARRGVSSRRFKIVEATPDSILAGVLEELIRERAYEIYAARGHQNGSAEQDWFEAEQQVLRKLTSTEM
jgi:hypothetical protein